MTRSLSCALALAACACATTEPAPNMADTQLLTQLVETGRFRYGHPSSVRITPSGEDVLFLRGEPRSAVSSLYEHDVATGRERALLTAASILEGAEQLSPEEQARRDRQRSSALGIASYELSQDGQRLLVPLSGRLFVVERESGRITELPKPAKHPVDPRLSPDGTRVASVRGGSVYVTDVETGVNTRVSPPAEGAVTWGLAEFVAQEEMDRHRGYWWAPDGRHLLIQRTDQTDVETLWLHDPMRPERRPTARRYPRAGTSNADVRLALFDVRGGEPMMVEWDRAEFPYLASVVWDASGPLTLVVQNRRQTVSQVLTVDPTNGQTTALFREEDAAWINLDQSVPRWLPGDGGLLWSTERNGRWALEVRARDGSLRRTVVAPELGYEKLLHVDPAQNTVVVRARPTPTEAHLYAVPLDGGPPRRLTTAAGEHHGVFGANGVWVHQAETLDGADRTVLRRGESEVRGVTSVAEEPPFVPNLELTTVACAIGECHAGIVRPRDFEKGRRYPVIVYVYGGPHHRVVTAEPRRYFLQQWMADQGAVVVMIDGRGTPGQGRDHERAIAGDVAAGALEDQVTGLKALGERYPELDLERVGIYGWSFGGYMTLMGLLRHPEIYKVGAAGAPVADWRDYDTHYTERYMGLPAENREGYDQANVLTWTDALARPLLLLHGTVDDNVYPVHTFKVSDALFRAGKPHHVLPLSGFTHHVRGPLPTRRLWESIAHFLLSHLRQ